MKKKISLLEYWGILFLVIFGSIFHFMFEWFGKPYCFAWIWPVNESVWEHYKLFLTPLLLWLIIEMIFLKKHNLPIFYAKGIELILQAIIMIGGFYLYTSILREHLFYIDIILFLLAILIGQYISVKFILNKKIPLKRNWFGVILLSVILSMVIIFTYFPPEIDLFYDHMNEIYGFQ